ncbi:MAG: Cys-Gln thioester bond-forming surface protein [Bacilli bacterium]|nr:Cys-Gln thioester bond-forming surface protein [Bacilli bacterium]
MKGKLKVIVLGILMGLLVGIRGVHALANDSKLTTQYIDNVYAYHYKNGVLMSYGKLPFRYQNGKLVYCIEPWRIINTNTYNSSDDWNISGYSEEEKNQMELIAHYGYGYDGHDSIKYYMATQELIWLFKDDYIKWTTEYTNNGLGEQINIDNEKNEILRLVNLHNVLPSFSGSCHTTYLKDKLVLTDTNNVLDNFDISSDLEYVKSGQTLTFNINKLGSFNIKLTPKNLNNDLTKIYYIDSHNSQKMASFGLSNKKNAEISIVSNKVHVRVNKRDSKTKNLINDEGTIFKIKDVTTNSYIIENLKVSKDGYAYIDLEKGKYEIEEVSASSGYVVNKNKKIIEINEDININDTYYDVDIFNDVPTGKINIYKVDEDGTSLDGVEIGLFDKNHKKIKTIITNSETGNFFDNLSLGTYYIKELNTLNGYLLDDKYYKVELKYKNDKTYIVEKNLKLINNKIKCDIVYITSSNEGGKLKNVEINVYDSDNKIVYSGKTDENGEVIIKDLPYGKYYIKQVKVPSGYILNEEEYTFYVNDSTCNGAINVTNDKTIMPVTSMGFSIYSVLYVLFMSLGIYNFVKKSN